MKRPRPDQLPKVCEHTELLPRRHPGALPVCNACGFAVLDFDVARLGEASSDCQKTRVEQYKKLREEK